MTSLDAPRFLNRGTPPHIATLVIMTGVSALTMSIFLPSLPQMAEYFHTDYAVMQLSVAVYLGMNAILQVFIGPISDAFGRRPVLLGGFAVFLVATLGCIYAPTAEAFLAFRMLQATVVVALALSRAVVRDMFGTAESASVIGYVTMGMSLVPMIGPAVGGILQEAFSWKASFWLLFFAGAGVLVLVWADLGETSARTGKSFRQQAREYPELLTSPRFWGYNVSSAAASGAFFAYLGGGPFVGIEVFHLEPTMLGIALGAPASGYFLGNFISGRYSARIGINRMVLWGSLILTGGLVLLILLFAAGLDSAPVFFGLMTVVGLANGMTLPNSFSGMLSVRPQLAGTASGLGGFLQIGGGAALSALAGYLLVPGSGAMPLLLIMLGTAIVALLAILYVIRRARQVGA